MQEIIAKIVKQLNLIPHPVEGGYFIETYRSQDMISAEALHPDYNGDRSTGTCIYYLLTPDTVSAMHRLCSDEIFHFYLGDPVEQLLLRPDGSSEVVTLGQDVLQGQLVQHIVPKNIWQGARLKEGGQFALLGCTVAPGFDFSDYVHGDRTELKQSFPQHADLIHALTPPDEENIKA